MKPMLRSTLKGVIALLFLATTYQLQAQWGPYQYQRPMSATAETWHEIELPNAVFAKIRRDYADLRIMGITPAGDTIEAPYILEQPSLHPAIKQSPFTLLNQSRKGDFFYVTLEAQIVEKINRIQLDITDENFDWKVNLSGSNDQREWFGLLQDYRIVSVANSYSNYDFTTLHFSESQYRYYRLAIPAEKKVGISAAHYYQEVSQDLDYRTYPISNQKITENISEKQTEIVVQLATAVPVSKVTVPVAMRKDYDYYRPIHINVVIDSTIRGDQTKYHYNTQHRSVLSSVEDPVFNFANTRTNQLRIDIKNYDNRGLVYGKVVVQGLAPVLKARFTEAAKYYLVYGHEKASAPRYDVAQFADKIPTGLTALTVGQETSRLSEDQAVTTPLFSNPIWLWGMMAVVIALLGWFSLKMLRSDGSKE